MRGRANQQTNKQTDGWMDGRIVGLPEALSLLRAAWPVNDELGSYRQQFSGRISIKPSRQAKGLTPMHPNIYTQGRFTVHANV